MSGRTYYAIGDIHGEAERLARLHARIMARIVREKTPASIVHVGDFIDRGPDSRAVVERLIAMQKAGAVDALFIKGNHEELMLHAYDNRDSIAIYYWAENGGDETIESYERANGAHDDWRDAIDRAHLSWLRTLPTMWRDEERKIAFVHGGIDPKTFPNCKDEIRLWTRSDKFFNVRSWPEREELKDWLIVHGHTPTEDFKPYAHAQRINVDTGVCWGGPLTCVVLKPGDPPDFLHA